MLADDAALALPAAPPAAVQAMQLALGTVQFGLAYGAVGSGRAVPANTARAILDSAWHQGLRWLDTAAAYGDIEPRLAALCGPHAFRIVSKIAPLGGVPADRRLAAVRLGVQQSLQRLGPRLHGLMFHRADDLLADDGPALWDAAQAAVRASGQAIRLGVSCYGPAELLHLRQTLDITIAQLPANALDQRLAQALAQPEAAAVLQGVHLQVRSAYLQGLLLAPAQGARRVPAAAEALARWQAACAARGLAPAAAALGHVRHLAGVAAPVASCVVGAETLAQWQETAAAWAQARPLHWPELACANPQAIDPRTWPAG